MTNPAATRRERRHRTRSDAELVQASRDGDRVAFVTLWQRHAEAARRAAQAASGSTDPDDLVSEAYTRILRDTQRGGGPTGAFRPYLFVTIKNIAVSWSNDRRATAPDVTAEAADEHPDPATLVADRTSLARAFRSLPELWRSVLWYVEVERTAPRELALIMGVPPNSAAALVHRAREGFRTAWLEAHVDEPERSEECRWAAELIVAGRGRRTRKIDRRRLDRHLGDCAACRILASDDRQPVRHLRAVLLVSTWGASAAAYAQLHSPAPAVAAVATPSIAPAALVAASVGVVLAVGGTVAALTSVSLPPRESNVVAEVSAEPSEAAPAPPRSPDYTAPTVPRTTPPPAPAEPPPAAPPAAAPDTPSTPAVEPSTEGSPPNAPVPSPRPTPTPVPTPTPTPTPDPPAVPIPTVDVPADLAAAVPAPLTGTGVPGAEIVAQDAAGRTLGGAVVAGDSTFALELDTTTAEEGATVRLIQRIAGRADSAPSPEVGPYLLPAPGLTGTDGSPSVVREDLDADGLADDVGLLLSGIPGAHVVVSVDGLPTGRVHLLEAEPLTRYVADLSTGDHVLTVRYSDAEGTRFGRPQQVVLTVLDDEDAEAAG